MESGKIMWNYEEVFGIISNKIKLCEIIWNYVELYEILWNYQELSVELFEIMYIFPELFGIISIRIHIGITQPKKCSVITPSYFKCNIYTKNGFWF